MTDLDQKESPVSPDRKRSLEDDASSDEDETRGGRFKRQALNSSESTAHPSPPRRDQSPDKRTLDLKLPGAPDSSSINPDGQSFDESSDPSASGAAGAAVKTMSVRSLITTKEAGIIIGKAGKHVAEIRAHSGAKVTVSEQVIGAHERILTVTGPLDHIAKAFSLIAAKIVEEQDVSLDLKSRDCSIKILVPHSRMGSVIGKHGSKIKEIQEASGAKITASEEMLPNSTERVVTVFGVIDSIHIATYHIGLVLQEYPERAVGTLPYKPQPSLARVPAGAIPVGGMSIPAGAGAYNIPMQTPYGAPGGPPNFYAPAPTHMAMQRGGPAMGPSGVMHPPQTLAVQMQQIFIPNEMVGAIIGKGGSKINEIRQNSGCQIKIAEPQDGSTDRLVTITGNPDANQMALYMLYSRLEAEKARQAGR